MTIDEEIAKVDGEISSIQKECDRIQDEVDSKMEKLTERKNSLRLIKLLRDRLLKNSEWELWLQGSQLILEFLSSPSNTLLNDLRNLFDAHWHSSVDLSETIHLRFDDNNLCLVFNNLDEMIDFVKLHELTIDLKNLNQEITRIKSLESMRDKLNNKLKK